MRPSPLLHTKSTGDILTARSELQITKPIIKFGKDENQKNPKEDESEDDDDKDDESEEREANKKTNAKSGDHDGDSANKGLFLLFLMNVSI